MFSDTATKLSDLTGLLDQLRADPELVEQGFISVNGKVPSSQGVDIGQPQLDCEAGSQGLPTVLARLEDGSLPSISLRTTDVHALFDRMLELFSSFLHGNTPTSTWGQCLYMHPSALATLSSNVRSSVVPQYRPSAGPSSAFLPQQMRAKRSTPVPAPCAKLSGTPDSTGQLMMQCVYTVCLGFLRIAAVSHDTVMCNALLPAEELDPWVAWAQGELDCAWDMQDEEVLRALLDTEAKLEGIEASSAISTLPFDALTSGQPAHTVLSTRGSSKEQEHEALVLHVRLVRYMLGAYVYMHPSRAQPAPKPFRWGSSYSLDRVCRSLVASHALLRGIQGRHGHAQSVLAVQSIHERMLKNTLKHRMIPAQPFDECIRRLQSHCANGTLVCALPALASYPTHAREGRRKELEPACQMGSQAGDDAVNHTVATSASTLPTVSAALHKRAVLTAADVPASGVTDYPLRWPDPIGARDVAVTRHYMQAPVPSVTSADGTLVSPSIPPLPVSVRLPVPDTLPDMRPLQDTNAFHPSLVAQPRQAVTLRALWAALREFHSRDADVLCRAWCSNVVLGMPVEGEEGSVVPQELAAAGYAFGQDNKLYKVEGLAEGNRPVGAGLQGWQDSPDWLSRDEWRVAHANSITLFASHTLYEVLAQDLRDAGVPGEYIWSREGRSFLAIAEGVVRVSLYNLAAFSRVDMRRKGNDLLPELHAIMGEARLYDAYWASDCDMWFNLCRFYASRTGRSAWLEELAGPACVAPGEGCAHVPTPLTTAHPAIQAAAAHVSAAASSEPLHPANASLEESVATVGSVSTGYLPMSAGKVFTFHQDGRMRMLLCALYSQKADLEIREPVGRVLEAWAASLLSDVCYSHLGEGAREQLYSSGEAIHVQWWAEAFTHVAADAHTQLGRMQCLSHAFPELSSLTADAVACAHTGACHSIKRAMDTGIMAALEVAWEKCKKSIPDWEGEKKKLMGEPGEDGQDVDELAIQVGKAKGKGKGKAKASSKAAPSNAGRQDPSSVALSYVRDCVQRDSSMSEGMRQLSLLSKLATATVYEASRAASAGGVREALLWEMRYLLHKAISRTFIAMHIIGAMTSPGAPTWQSEGVPDLAGQRYMPQELQAAAEAGFAAPITSPPPSTFSHPSKSYNGRWRDYTCLEGDATSPWLRAAIPSGLALYAYEGVQERWEAVLQLAKVGITDPVQMQALTFRRWAEEALRFIQIVSSASARYSEVMGLWATATGSTGKEAQEAQAKLKALLTTREAEASIAAMQQGGGGAPGVSALTQRLITRMHHTPGPGELLWSVAMDAEAEEMRRKAAAYTVPIMKGRNYVRSLIPEYKGAPQQVYATVDSVGSLLPSLLVMVKDA